MQTLAEDKAAVSRIFQEFDKLSPLVHPTMGQLTTTGRCLRGLSHLLGITVEATVCFPLDFVVCYQDFCWRQYQRLEFTTFATADSSAESVSFAIPLLCRPVRVGMGR